jgi:phage-related protein
MKPICWLGDSRKVVKGFSAQARHDAGIELLAVQIGSQPADWKPMPSVGIGVNEIRVHAGNEYRVLYVAKFPEAVYVLHAFGKKTRQTAQHDIDVARRRYREMLNVRREK